MALSAFDDGSAQPREEDLARALGKAHGAWLRVLASVSETIPTLGKTWGFTSAKTGWSLRLKHKDRVLAYLTPQANKFLVSLSLGEKAVQAAHEARMPNHVLAVIDSAPKYAEGRGCRFEVTEEKSVEALAGLIGIKHAK